MPPTRAILTYHSLEASRSVISLRPEIFRRHMRSLVEQKIAVVSLEDILSPRHDGETQPAVALTFDDGFADFLYGAYPLLHENHFPATVFLVSGYCGKMNDWSLATLRASADELCSAGLTSRSLAGTGSNSAPTQSLIPT